MKKKHRATREELQRARQEKRRYPYTENTRLIELVDKKHYGDMVKLINKLRPHLMDGEGADFVLTRLYFRKESLATCRWAIYIEIALFLRKVKLENGLTCSQLALFRYLTSPEHSNIAISANGLKSLISEAMRQIV